MPLSIVVDFSDPLPLYAQLDRALRLAIATGRLLPGEQLPTVRQLAVDLRVNANTIAKVYAGLERDGLLESRRGVGTFVRATETLGVEDGRELRLQQLQALIDRFLVEAAGLGFTLADALHFLRARNSAQENNQ